MEKFNLYYVDDFGTLYLHAGNPSGWRGHPVLEYRGRKGMVALACWRGR